MKIVFFGTPDFAVPTLKKLVEEHEIVTVVTQPDRKKNRGQKLHASAVKEAALSLGIPLIQPERISAVDVPSADLYVVVAYGQIFDEALLSKPRLGCYNLHASLLPRYRGAAPIQRAIEAGETETGVCVMKMERGLDTGDVLLCGTVSCEGYDSVKLSGELAELGAQLMLDSIALLERGEAVFTPQGDGASYAKRITKDDYQFCAEKSYHENIQKIRAFGYVHAVVDGKRMKIFSMRKKEELHDGEGLTLKVCDGYAEILELQPDNSKRMSARAYMLGRRK